MFDSPVYEGNDEMMSAEFILVNNINVKNFSWNKEKDDWERIVLSGLNCENKIQDK